MSCHVIVYRDENMKDSIVANTFLHCHRSLILRKIVNGVSIVHVEGNLSAENIAKSIGSYRQEYTGVKLYVTSTHNNEKIILVYKVSKDHNGTTDYTIFIS